MKHHRSPTHSYPHHAALALHSSIPTLLSPLRPIANNNNTLPGDDALDDFQSNAWVDATSYRPTLAGLGITYLRDASRGQPLALEHSALQIPVDGHEAVLSLPAEIRETHIPPQDALSPYRGFESGETRRIAPRVRYGEPAGHLELGLDSDIDSMASDTIGLIPDVNMYDKLRRLDLPHSGVNPLDTIRGTSLHDTRISYGEPVPTTPKDHHDDILPTTGSVAEQSPSPQVIQDIMSILIRPVPEFSFLPWPTTNSPSVQRFSPSQLAAPRSSVSVKPESINVLDNEHHALPTSYGLEHPAAHSSPILNAHLGIELNELISRAKRFRTKYPERDIDRAWLSHFAGKLSDRGELLDDFRCYVTGCNQRNKRRDHILVHIGAHIGQRPFACSVCPLRFLRKNECKRHEASHSGFRPYTCEICGQSFVRQDLVKRHVRRTHELRDENESGVGVGVAKQSRKRAKIH